MLIFTQDFNFATVIPIWDSFICHYDRDNFIYYICSAFLLTLRDLIIIFLNIFLLLKIENTLIVLLKTANYN